MKAERAAKIALEEDRIKLEKEKESGGGGGESNVCRMHGCRRLNAVCCNVISYCAVDVHLFEDSLPISFMIQILKIVFNKYDRNNLSATSPLTKHHSI